MPLDPDREPTESQWTKLTTVPEKRTAFSVDLYFREGWADAAAVFGNAVTDRLASLAIMNFKPDGVVGRRMRAGLEFVLAHGFVPLAARRMPLTRHSARELWRHNWNFYTTDRLAMSTLLYTGADALLLLLRGPAGDPVPASVRLSGLKGSADPAKRRPGQLRTVLDPPNSIINFVHVADEPADLVRELAIFCDRADRRALLAGAADGAADGADATAAALAEIDVLEAAYAEHDFDPTRSIDRLRESGALAAAGAERLHQAVRRGERLPWEELAGLVSPADPRADVWDFISVCTVVLHQEREAPDLLRDSTVAEWGG
jgi:hypothetical protein